MVDLRRASFLAVSMLSMLILLALPRDAQAQEYGKITGRVTDAKSGERLPSINVVVKGTSLGASTDGQGGYTISQVPAGTYTLGFSAVGYTAYEAAEVRVEAGAGAAVDAALEPTAVPLGEVDVYGASFRRERITEAPAAVSVVDAKEIKLNASHGQLPRLLENEPGVDIVQSGMQDFNINTRGFNSSLNRRLLVLMDGRDLAIAFLGAQEWNGLTVPLEDLGRLELVRGPGSALYGPNAFNGVINLSTPTPAEAAGTKISASAGEKNLFRSDLRNGGVIDEHWSYKANIGRVQSKSWSRSRTLADTNAQGEFEYSGLRAYREVRPLDNNATVSSSYGSGRVDYNFTPSVLATAEGGVSLVENELFVTGIGRVQVVKASKPWGRVHFGSERLNVMVWGQGRSSLEPQYSLATGKPLEEKSSIYHAEAQYNFLTLEDRLRVVLGGSHRIYDVNTEGTLTADAHHDNTSGVFGQMEYSPVSWIKLVGAGRWDRSTLHSDQWSPKAGVVWIPAAEHSFRATFNRAFQVPNYSEYFLRADAGSADLPFFASPANPSGTTPIAARGNSALSVEHITGYELGYKGIFLEKKVFLSVDGYENRATNFVTDLLQNVNPAYPFALPPGFPAGLADIARSNVPGLSLIDGRPTIVVSYTNAGKVDERGVEVGTTFYVSDEMHFDGTWTWYDFQVREQQAGDVLLPNAPKHKFSLGATYRNPRGFDVSLTGRNIQGFRWAAGIFQGNIQPYTLVNLSAGYQLSPVFRVGATVSNLLDHKVYQIFGGSLIGRQAIATVTATL